MQITLKYTQQVEQSQTFDLPAYIKYSGSYYKIVSDDTFIQVIPESATGEVTLKKWQNQASVKKILTDATSLVVAETEFEQLFNSAKDSILG